MSSYFLRYAPEIVVEVVRVGVVTAVVAVVGMILPATAFGFGDTCGGGCEGSACACDVDDGCLHDVSALIYHAAALLRY
jgi:uncharacterized membrane protein YedE/YeeE